MSSTCFCPTPKTAYPVEREDNGDTLVFDVQEVSPWTPKVNTSISCTKEKMEDKNSENQTLTCDGSLSNIPSMIDLLTVLDNDESYIDTSSRTYEEVKEKKDELVLL